MIQNDSDTQSFQSPGQSGFRKIGFASTVWRCLDRAARSQAILRPANWQSIKPLLTNARRNVTIAEDQVIAQVLQKNPDIVRIAEPDPITGELGGLLAILPLTELGLEALITGVFDGLRPDQRWICGRDEQPNAIYIWLVYMPGSFGRRLSAIASALDEYLMWPCPIFSVSTNDHAARLHRTAGFLAAKNYYPACKSELLVVFPTKESVFAPQPKSQISIARTIEDIFQVFSVRSATYMAEQFCLYSEEFDGNDFCATHWVGKINGDVAGCIRARFFDGFAKIERLAVRAEYRNSRLAYQLVRAAVEHCRMKGYRRLYGHSRLDLVRFWQVFGFRPLESRPAFAFANVQYVEMICEAKPHPNAVTLDADPMLLIRPEGAWDEPGPFDHSRATSDPRLKKMLKERTRTLSRQAITA